MSLCTFLCVVLALASAVERHCIEKLPMVSEEFHDTDTVIKVGDSRPGWAKSLKELIAMLYTGQLPKFDVSLKYVLLAHG